MGGVVGTQRCEADGEGYDRCMCSHAEDDGSGTMSDPEPDFTPEPDDTPMPRSTPTGARSAPTS